MMITSRRFSGASKRPSLVEHYPPPRTATADSHAGTDWSSLCDKGDRREDCMTSLQHQDAATNLFIVPTSSDGSTITTSIPVVVGGKTIPHEALPRIPQVQPTRRRIHLPTHNNTATTASATQDEDNNNDDAGDDDHDHDAASPLVAPVSIVATTASASGSCCLWSVASESKRRKSLVLERRVSLQSTIPMVADNNNNEKNSTPAWIPPTEVVMVPVESDEAGRMAEASVSAVLPPFSDATAPSVSTTSPDPAGATTSTPGPSPESLALLARQLEYYFSERNLSKDTYLQTLRTLNDGCVPATILADFAKVRTILCVRGVGIDDDGGHESRLHAVLQAVSEHTDLLQIRSIETSTGKIVTDDTPSSAPTILAVGTLDHQPLRLLPASDAASSAATGSPVTSSTTTSSSSSSSTTTTTTTTTTTIILRDVPPDTTEDDVRELFQFDDCPAIESLRPDVAHCWYVRTIEMFPTRSSASHSTHKHTTLLLLSAASFWQVRFATHTFARRSPPCGVASTDGHIAGRICASPSSCHSVASHRCHPSTQCPSLILGWNDDTHISRRMEWLVISRLADGCHLRRPQPQQETEQEQEKRQETQEARTNGDRLLRPARPNRSAVVAALDHRRNHHHYHQSHPNNCGGFTAAVPRRGPLPHTSTQKG